MIKSADELLGIGIYTPEEAAKYARISTQTAKRWVFGDSRGEPVFRRQLADSSIEERLVTFLDFVQLMAVRAVRVSQKSFPLPKIRAACDKAIREFNVQYPLATEHHRILLFGPRDNPKLCEMVIEVGRDERGECQYELASGKDKGHRLITKIVEPFIAGITFDNCGMAERYIAWKAGEKEIVMDPKIRFGEPYLPSCGYTAQGLWEGYISEGTIEDAARIYGVDVTDVDLAVQYHDHLVGSGAA